MIRGYFRSDGPRRRPYVAANFVFPTLNNRALAVPLLLDTGADRTILAPDDGKRLNLPLSSLSRGAPSVGVGGQTNTFRLPCIVMLGSFTTEHVLTVFEPVPSRNAIPSLLGRDLLSRFALYLDQAANLVVLLEPNEAEAVRRLLQ